MSSWDRCFYTSPISQYLLKAGGESALSEVIITGSEEWAKLNRCYLIGNSVKVLCDSKANDTSMGPERNSFIGKYIEEMEGV